ncbi:MAG: hypothetical protein DI635_15470 [Pseudoxanthomonas suwonensis]|nr:MAG: hypothetical protein DI635_15470 [Pseudoxanthomonas suwonensis]
MLEAWCALAAAHIGLLEDRPIGFDAMGNEDGIRPPGQLQTPWVFASAVAGAGEVAFALPGLPCLRGKVFHCMT